MNDQSDQSASIVSPYDVSEIVNKLTDTLSDAEKIQFLNKCWRPTPASCNLDTQRFRGNKKITFQLKWLDQRKWLAYSAHPEHKGGWCVTCLLFLTEKEKESLGAFVKTPFRNYNKSNEKLDGHESTEYHKRALDRVYTIRAQATNLEKRIDTQINAMATQNVQENKAVLPHIIDAVMLCAKQQIALRGHRDDKVDFAVTPQQMKATLSPSYGFWQKTTHD